MSEDGSTCALLVVGCGNLLRGDDGVGPILIRHLWEGGVPDDVRLVDGGTAGMDVSFQMRGAERVIIVDASRTGQPPGTVYKIPGPAVEDLPPLGGLHTHMFRWDNALAFARWLLGDGYPKDVTVYLIEAVNFDPGAALTDVVQQAMHEVIGLIRGEPAFAADVAMADATAAPTPTTTNPPRPLPIGTFPLPFGYLLIPGGAATEAARARLLQGRLPQEWPAALRGHQLALAEDFEGALAAFAGSDPVSRFNHFVIAPEQIDVAELRAALADLDGSGELARLVDVVQFTVGLSDVVPDPAGATGEVLALVLAAGAAAAATAGDMARAVDLVEQAVLATPDACRGLAGVLHGALGHLHRSVGALQSAVTALTRGIALLGDTDLRVACAEQQLELGTTFHEQAGDRPDLLLKAVQHYHDAITMVGEQESPDLFAAAHANLATAYLTMPMIEASDTLRLGVAVGSLRAALGVYTPQTHPRQWASAQLNLANALVYAPSTHQGDNLVEAVELYEAVLLTRNREDDPLGYARVLANQGNALAHLGLFDHAWGKLVEARFLFEEFHDYDAVTSVRGVLDEIARQRVLIGAAPDPEPEPEPADLSEAVR